MLDELAQRAGIEPRFRDGMGSIHETSTETKIALLSAMGLRAEDDAAAAIVLEELEAREWRSALPPVIVATIDAPVTVPAVVHAGARCACWRLVFEDGDERSGVAQFNAETVLARRRGDSRNLERHRAMLPSDLPTGYHQLELEGEEAKCRVIVSPGQCWLPPAAARNLRLWGVAAQLYLLRSARNWGIGDFSDLGALIRLVEERGGNVLGLNPLHSMFLDNPEHASPYSPQDRLLLNVLNIDVEAVPELADSPEARQLMVSEDFARRLRECRNASLVDYAGVSELKIPVLKLLFERCRTARDAHRWQEFEAFRRCRGAWFEQSCLFEALRQHFAKIHGALADWHAWPEEYRHPASPAVARFAEKHAGDVALYAWMQWVADQQLGAASAAARDMQVGLYRDLAVGTDRGGSVTWRRQDLVVCGANAGAPPDVFNPSGQNWGLPPFDPRVLAASGYENFIELLRANMRHAGGLRIDHAMAMQHLYWVPDGVPASEGAYVRYPLEDLVRIVALESQRQQCLVVGEDLGTVPEGFRERMAKANILSYRVLFFEQRETGDFLLPHHYSPLSLAVAGSHDLPTIKAWWRGADIDLKQELKLYPPQHGPDEARQRRERDRRELLKALGVLDLISPDEPMNAEKLILAVHAFLAKTNSLITMVQLDDITAEIDPVNVPATCDEHPNWRRRLSVTLEDLDRHPRLDHLAQIFRTERPSG